MTDANDQLRPALFRAEAALRAVEAFVRTFDEPGGPEQLAALLDGKRFRRAVLGEDPGAVAAEHLVRPCLQALGYAAPAADPGPDRPRFRPHPGTLPEAGGAGRSPPRGALDFELATAEPPLSGVVAVAPPNAERPPGAAGRRGPATAAVREYLADDAVGAHLRGRGVPAAVGVATDGLRWGAWVRSAAGEGAVRRVERVTVKGVVEAVAGALLFDGDPPARWRVHARRDLDGTLVALASADRLPRRAVESVDDESVDVDAVDDESVDDESVDGESVDGESVDDESVDDEGGT